MNALITEPAIAAHAILANVSNAEKLQSYSGPKNGWCQDELWQQLLSHDEYQ